MYKKNRKSWFKHFDFMLFDLVIMELSFLISFFVRFGSVRLGGLFGHGSIDPHLYIAAAIVVIHLAVTLFFEPYANILKRNTIDELKATIKYCAFMFFGVVLYMFMVQSGDIYSRIMVFVFPVVSVVLVFWYRYFYKKFLIKRINRDANQRCMLLVGDMIQIRKLLRSFEKNTINLSKVVGLVILDDMESIEASDEYKKSLSGDEYTYRGVPVVGYRDSIYDYSNSNVVDEVILCSGNSEIDEIAHTFISMGIVVHIAVSNFISLPQPMVGAVNGIPVITASVNRVTLRQIIIKRGMDILFGFIGSVITLILTIFIGPAIMIADPGPVFFRQERVGKNGRTFKIWKFRSMYMDAEERKAELMKYNKMDGLMFKMDNDPRIIGAGKKFSLGQFLRESSLDEFPQFFNILAGDMSLVGTRPPTVKEYEQYELRHKGRLAVRPGLTGMWQVSGRSDIEDFEEVVRLDKEYIENFSIGLDMRIILKTFKVVLGKIGSQ